MKDYIEPIIIIAVPVFFMITGYFLLGKDGTIKTEKIKRTFIKILKITIVANVIYFAFHVCVLALLHPDLLVDYIPSSMEWVRLLLFGDVIGFHLWYLAALLEALIVLYVFAKFNLMKFLPVMAIIGLSIFFLNRVFGCFEALPYHCQVNFFTIAIPYLYLGMLVRLNEHRITANTLKLGTILCCIVILLYVEHMFSLTSQSQTIMSLPLTVCLFILAIKLQLRNNWVANIGRNHSSTIYIFHILVLINLDSNALHLIIPSIEAFEVFIATLLFSVFLHRSKRTIACVASKFSSKNE
jgi:surface polysaccharide O-acyltransferase-like enzyme